MKKASFIFGIITGAIMTAFVSIIVFTIYGNWADDTVVIEENKNESENEAYNDFDEKVEEINKVLEEYYYEAYDENLMWEGAYDGYISGIGDPYTSYFTKEQYESFMEDTAGSYEGIGVVVSFGENGEDIEVVSPFPDSPGEKAGVMPGDRILQVNGIDITGFTLEEVVKEIKGPKGTEVIVGVYRESTGEILDLTIERDVINEQTVSHEMLEGDIGYIRLSGFEMVTYKQFMKAYDSLEEQGQKGMIIDLRFNPGGLVSIVSKIADELLPEGLIVYTEDKSGYREQISSDEKKQFNKPLVILVNGYSASASEILSGAVKDYGIGTIIGTTTYGKGLVQAPFVLDDGSALKVTIAKYFTPNGNYINEVGIEPDITVELPEEYQNRYYIEKENDTQLQKAIEVIETEIQ